MAAVPDADALRRVDEAFAEFHALGRAPGLAYGVVADGRLVHAAGLGTLRAGEDATPGADSAFRIASMTKSFTASAVLLLRDRGRLRLDDPVALHVPAAAGLRGPTGDAPALTLRDLLGMVGGLPTDDAWADRLEEATDADVAALVADGATFAWTPRTRFAYANLGYVLLGQVVSAAAGRPYLELVRDELLAPLGLARTGWLPPADDVATGHVAREGGWVVEPDTAPGAFSALGGLWSTVTDIAAWVAGLADAWPPREGEGRPHPLGRADRRELAHPVTLLPVRLARGADGGLRPVAESYCLGLVAVDDPVLGRVVGHSGGYPGFGSHMRFHPGSGLGVVALANGRYAGPSTPAATALDLLVAAARRQRPGPVPALAAVVDDVVRLVTAWDDALAARLLGPNVAQDEPLGHRRDAAAALVARYGPLVLADDTEHDSPTQARLWLDGAAGSVAVDVALEPERIPRVQTLELTGVPRPPAHLQAAAEALVGAANAGAVDGRVARELAVLYAPCSLGRAVGGDGAATATFAVRGRGGLALLELEGAADDVRAELVPQGGEEI